MKKHLFALAFGLTAVMGSSLLVASDNLAETGTVPFDFQVGNTRMPAGDYSASLTSTHGAIHLRNQATLSTIIVSAGANMGGNRSEAKLVFHKYGERYILAEVWFAEEQFGHKLPTAKLEKELQASLNGAAPQQIYLAMR